jgi:all-trans-8'-apo-beta-carotenal 15,15'-oxygenase
MKTTLTRKIMAISASSTIKPNRQQTNQSPHPWAKCVQHTAIGFDLTALPILSGSIPVDLRGTLYRNGPGRLNRGTRSVGHWFDGDGAVLGVTFTDSGATGIYKYVQTDGYKAEEKADRYLFGGYGSHGSESWLGRWKGLKNVANTNVLATTDKLLALWEGGLPHELNLETLETVGLNSLSKLTSTTPFSAHPKVDPKTHEIFNFGVSFGPKNKLHLYRCNPQGTIVQTRDHELSSATLLHDFAMVGRYLIFCIPPLPMDLLPLIAKTKTFSEALTWKPEQGTQIVIFDRNTLELVRSITTDPWFQWHFGNGEELADGTVLLELIRYEDFETNAYVRDIPTGNPQTYAPSRLMQLRISPNNDAVVCWETLWDKSCEFPTVNPQVVGKPWRYTYFSTHRPGTDAKSGELYEAFGRLDRQTGEVTISDCGAHHYISETVYAPGEADRGSSPNDRGWLLSVIFDAEADRSEVWIHDADSDLSEPVCRLALPEIIPFGFHGTWRSHS